MKMIKNCEALTRIATATDACAFAVTRLLQSCTATVHFAHDATLKLAATDIGAICFDDDAAMLGADVLLQSQYLGLSGTTSPLPQETLLALNEAMDGDEGRDFAAFVHLVQGRLLQLLHLGVTQGQPSTCLTTTVDDVMSQQLLAYSAYAKALPARLRLATWAALNKPHCSHQDVCWAVGQVLHQYDVPTAIRCVPLTGSFLARDDADMWSLGMGPHTLGESAVLGDTAAAVAGRVQVVLGPVDAHWLQAVGERADLLAQDIVALLRALLPLQVQADVSVTLLPHGGQDFRLGIDALCSGAKKTIAMRQPLRGLGMTTTLGAPTCSKPYTVNWPVANAMLLEAV